MSKKVQITLSGVGINPYYDGQLYCNYIYMSSNADHEFNFANDLNYTYVATQLREELPIVLTYTDDSEMYMTAYEGLNIITESTNLFSIYKREYQYYEKYTGTRDSYNRPIVTESLFQGPWIPVALQTSEGVIRDFNITSGRSYQYIIYPVDINDAQQYANTPPEGSHSKYADTGVPVKTNWDEWSLTELIPVSNSVDAPILKKTYRADINNVWLFKYSLETGTQTQNFTKSEIQTLGQFSRFSYGRQNYISGEVSCLLGSEIVPYSLEGYVERMRSGITAPLSTNEKTYMLQQWRKIAFSPNPKLLKDIKGQSWIVQIVSNSNTPKNFYYNQPDVISFSWKQIDSTDNVVITGDGRATVPTGGCNSLWKPIDNE